MKFSSILPASCPLDPLTENVKKLSQLPRLQPTKTVLADTLEWSKTYLYGQIKNRIDIGVLRSLWNRQGGRCAVTGLDFLAIRNDYSDYLRPAVDARNPKFGLGKADIRLTLSGIAAARHRQVLKWEWPDTGDVIDSFGEHVAAVGAFVKRAMLAHKALNTLPIKLEAPRERQESLGRGRARRRCAKVWRTKPQALVLQGASAAMLMRATLVLYGRGSYSESYTKDFMVHPHMVDFGRFRIDRDSWRASDNNNLVQFVAAQPGFETQFADAFCKELVTHLRQHYLQLAVRESWT